MDSLATIINDLKNIATGMNYTGPTVDALIYLLANGIQKNNLNSTVAVLEASGTRCKLLNSAIQHAKDLGYSVNRGTNQHIVINNLQVIESRSVKKFDQAAKIGNYYLYFAKDYTLKSDNLEPIDFIVGKTPIEETVSVVNQSNLLRLSTTSTNFSSEVEIQDESGQSVVFSENRHDVFTNKDAKLWVATSTDYGIELYNYSHDADSEDLATETSEEKISRWVYFNPGSSYTIKSVAYTPDMIELSAIKSIPGFKLPPNPLSEMRSWPSVDRETDVLQIYLNSQEVADSSFVLRASKDLENGIPASVASTPVEYSNSEFYYYGGSDYPYIEWKSGEPDWPTEISTNSEQPGQLTDDESTYLGHEGWIRGTLLQNLPKSLLDRACPSTTEEFASDDFKEIYRTLVYPLMGRQVDTGAPLKKYPLLVIYYLTQHDSYLETSQEAAIIDYIQRAYFVTQSTCCIKAMPTTPFKFYITIYYTQTIDVSSLEAFIESYSTHIGEAYDPYSIIGELTKNFTGIHHISFNQPAGFSEPDTTYTEIQPCQYVSFDINIDQQPYVSD